jgi:hypothetical protein
VFWATKLVATVAARAHRAGKSAKSFSYPLIVRRGLTFLLVSEQTNTSRISKQTNAHETASMREAL